MSASSSLSSPDSLQLRKKPMIGPRLGNRGAAVAVAVVVVLLGVLVFNTETRKSQNAAKPKAASSEADMRLAPAEAGAEAVTRGVSDELMASASAPAPAFDMAATMAPMAAAGAQPAVAYGVPDLSGAASGAVPQLDMSEAERQLIEEQQRAEADARKAGTGVQGWSTQGEAPGGSSAMNGLGAGAAGAGAVVPGLADLEAMGKQMAAMQAGGGMPGQQQPDDQAKKKEFLAATQQIEPPYLAAQRQAPRTAYELKTGAVIPGVMISGINSDLPGEVSGMVTDNVYDSASGRFLLIPAWTRIFGKYDSEVAYGQARALVVWTRLIFPDGSTLELGGMQGADVSGYSGFKDKVDNHYARLIGFSALSSVMAAGMQLSQPQEDNGSGQLSNRQIVAGEAGRELSQLGVELTRRNLNVQPTIKIRNGYRFTITVNRDVAFSSPYVTK